MFQVIISLHSAYINFLPELNLQPSELVFFSQENSALCGLRNGAIVNVDFRLRPHSNFRLTRQRVALHSNNTRKSLSGASQNAKKHWFEVIFFALYIHDSIILLFLLSYYAPFVFFKQAKSWSMYVVKAL